MMKLFPRTVDSQFVIRFIKDEVSQEEREFFVKWLEESDANKEEYANLVLLWDRMGNSRIPPAPDQDEQWAKILNKINEKEASLSEASETKIPDTQPLPITNVHRQVSIGFSASSSDWRWLLRVAAVLIIATGLFIISENYLQMSKPVKPAPKDEIITVAKSEASAQKGERVTVPLPDGSIVYLNSDSKLIYPNYFIGTERQVELRGEAYFVVKHNKQKPFKVLCGNTVTTVTGTEFNIRNRDNKISVVVAKGSVKTLNQKTSEVVNLAKGDMLVLGKSGHFSEFQNVNLNYFLAWRTNKLNFSHTPLKEAMSEIERYYNVEVVFENNTVKQKTISGVFETESLDNVLSIISLALDVNITHNGRKVLIQ